MGFGNFLFEAARNSTKLISRKSPLILTCVGIGLGVTSTIMAVKATPEANDIYTKIKNSDLPENEKRKEVIKNVVPLYLPSALAGGLSIASIIGGYKINTNRLAELTTAYLLANNSLQDYKKTIIEKYGKEADEEIENDIAKERLEKYSRSLNEGKNIGEDPSYDLMLNQRILIRDTMTGQRYRARISDIYTACLNIADRLSCEPDIPISEFYYDIAAEGVDYDASCCETTGWLPGDAQLLVPHISSRPVCDELDGKLYYTLRIDTNPLYASYVQTARK